MYGTFSKFYSRFVKSLEDEEVDEGESLTISCKSSTNLSLSDSTSANSAPVFVQDLTNQEIEEGESLTLTCTSEQRSALQRPVFLHQLSDQEVEEGQSLTLNCKSEPVEQRLTPPKFVRGNCNYYNYNAYQQYI